jgi:protein ImuB
MPLPGKRRATPAVQPSPVTVRNQPGPRPAPGGGRGAGKPVRAAATNNELWLAIHLPHFVLESLRRRTAAAQHVARQDPGTATVVVDLEGGGKVVCAGDAAAVAAGVTRGMALNSALALLPGLHVLARDAQAERALLEAVATSAIGFTPRVVLEPPDAVLLEVRGSLRLFGGVRRFIAQVRERLQSLGLAPLLALTPTPLASLWFARMGEEVALRSRDGLASRLARLPLACARWPEKRLEPLAAMGVRTIGDCLKLPRDGFARRFAPQMLRALDRAVGCAPDPRVAFVPRERYSARRDLEPEISDTERLGRAAGPLVDELCSFLALRCCGVDVLDFSLLHRDVPPTRVCLRFAEPTAQAGRMAELLRERLARTELPGPVRALRLRSGPLVVANQEAGDLFARARGRSTSVPQLVERLRARLGTDSVYGIQVVPEHRPESAWEKGDILPGRGHSPGRGYFPGEGHSPFRPTFPVAEKAKGNVPSGENVPPRPLWLLAEPQPLDGREHPRYEGRLEFEEGPERIESGWWDGRDVRRDYYVARTAGGVRLWVFRERRAEGRWFLHGVFG